MNNQPYQSFGNGYGQPQPQMAGASIPNVQGGFGPNNFNGGGQGQPAMNTNSSSSKEGKPLGLVIGLILSLLLAATFIGLFIWMYIRADKAETDVEGQINEAVATAVNEAETKLEESFLEREKSPYSTFSGPADYGGLQFQYPKTWSVYEAKDASKGGDYEAYLNPDKVYTVGSGTINSLRVIIKDQQIDNYLRSYESNLKNGKLTVSTRVVNGVDANVYTGELPNRAQGIVCVFKLRDKTVVLQTDAMLFSDDFFAILDTVTYTN